MDVEYTKNRLFIYGDFNNMDLGIGILTSDLAHDASEIACLYSSRNATATPYLVKDKQIRSYEVQVTNDFLMLFE